MVTMKQKYEIIIGHFREGKSLRQISRDLGINRKTVKRYVSQYKLSEQSGGQSESSVVLSSLRERPVYDSSNRSKHRLTTDIAVRIDELLKQNKNRRDEGFHKQQMKKIDIHSLLCEEGFSISYSTVCNYIREKEQSGREAYIRQEYAPASSCEFDWGEVKLLIGGKLHRLQLAVFTSAYSNYRYAVLYWRQDTLSFGQSHVDFFAHCGGVFHTMVYDNMRVAVTFFTGKQEKQPTESFLSLALFYGFSYRFCNIRKGNEKGHVERSVEYVRRKAFSHTIDFETLAAANAHLLQVCDKLNSLPMQNQQKSIRANFGAETSHLYSLKGAFECSQLTQSKVDKYSCIQVDSNHYSVPDHLVGRYVDIRCTALKLAIYYRDKFQCSHHRISGRAKWQINLSHYLSTLERKPGALPQSVAFKQASNELQELYYDYFTQTPCDFIRLLGYLKKGDTDIENLRLAIEKTKQQSPHDVTADKIIIVCQNICQGATTEPHRGDIEHSATAQLQEISRLLQSEPTGENTIINPSKLNNNERK